MAPLTGCRSHDVAVTPPPAPVAAPTVNLTPEVKRTAPSAGAGVRASVERLLSESGRSGRSSPFPAGTQLVGVAVDGSTVTLDFSSQFANLKSMGDTTESLAQSALRRALAKYGNLKTMRVTVEGKPYESDMTDWSTPFPVRGEGASGPSGGEPKSGGNHRTSGDSQ
jgi:hypothetical protein